METTSSKKREEILDVAEHMIRVAGYNGFSTRGVADAVGIKAASVYYYFPSKPDIGVAVTERYTDRFIESLGDPESFPKKSPKVVKAYIDAFRHALVKDKKLCLCVVLGAESGGLPPDVSHRTKIFFSKNLEWLQTAFKSSFDLKPADSRRRANLVLASVEGGLVLSCSLYDNSIFEDIAASLLNYFNSKSVLPH